MADAEQNHLAFNISDTLSYCGKLPANCTMRLRVKGERVVTNAGHLLRVTPVLVLLPVAVTAQAPRGSQSLEERLAHLESLLGNKADSK